MARHSYHLETLVDGAWVRLAGSEVGREYGLGYLAARRESPGPRLGCRLVRDDGRVVGVAPEQVWIGPVVGWATAAQYRAAAARALAAAEAIDARERKAAERRGEG